MLPRCKLWRYKEKKKGGTQTVVNSQLGAQFDGYCSTVATTIVIGANGAVIGPKADVIQAARTALEAADIGPKADAIQAARTALEAAVRMIRPGNKVIENLFASFRGLTHTIV